jgi:hypothetical protein
MLEGMLSLVKQNDIWRILSSLHCFAMNALLCNAPRQCALPRVPPEGGQKRGKAKSHRGHSLYLSIRAHCTPLPSRRPSSVEACDKLA